VYVGWLSGSVSAALLLLLAALAIPGPAVGAEKLDLPEGLSLWQKSVSIRTGFGYNDNVTLSSFNPVGSPFVQVSADIMFFRLPWNNWQFTFFANGSDARYLNADTEVNNDQHAIAVAQLTRFLGRDWKSISTLQYLFLNQVMDVSADYNTPARQEVFAQGITGTQGVRKEIGRYWGEANFSVSRYFVRQPFDSYWQGGPELKLGRTYGSGSEAYLSYQIAPIYYDTRQQADADGAPVPGTHLRFLPQTVGITWQHHWDQERRWRCLTQLTYSFSQDNGSGYYDYAQYLLSEQLRFRPAKWDFSAQVALAYYDFPNQQVDLAGSGARHRTAVRMTLRAERVLSSHWKIYAQYDYDRSLSNDAFDQYSANAGSAGIEFSF
ncbi:MAG: hypothetical protein WCL11_27805, partial [Verrucomicrobiota bacterium]